MATTYLNAADWLQHEMENNSWKDECHIRYPTRTTASQRAKRLRDLQLQRLTGESRSPKDVSYRELQIGTSTEVRFALSEAAGLEPELLKIAKQITEAKTVVPVEKRLKRLASFHLALSDDAVNVDPLAGYNPAEISPEAGNEWKRSFSLHRTNALAFLRQLVNACQAQKPNVDAPAELHHVRITSNREVFIDGSQSNLRRSRKAALFILFILGTKDVRVEDFAKLYSATFRNYGDAGDNPANIMGQAMIGLRKSLPLIRSIPDHSGRRTITGLVITSEATSQELREFVGLIT